ncbi:substrate-binding domain-containing protein [Nocardia amikacinitolerans]|uniref:substrate-binding domain-containing protein n=1 Tax=Nocardia amikacinitolerans TaxID=756689 RepID=UPI0035561E0E
MARCCSNEPIGACGSPRSATNCGRICDRSTWSSRTACGAPSWQPAARPQSCGSACCRSTPAHCAPTGPNSARHPECALRIRRAPFVDPFGALRRGDFDALVVWLPVEEPDLTVGPVLFTDDRVLAVSEDHELANSTTLSVEMLADFRHATAPDMPQYWEQAYLPFVTPCGRPIQRVHQVTHSDELINLITAGEIVHARPRRAWRLSKPPTGPRGPTAANCSTCWPPSSVSTSSRPGSQDPDNRSRGSPSKSKNSWTSRVSSTNSSTPSPPRSCCRPISTCKPGADARAPCGPYSPT